MEVNLGRVVGSKIRNGNDLPTNFTGWLDGDIFILNDKEVKYYEYKKETEQLVLLGNFSGPQGPVGPQGPAGTDAEYMRRIKITYNELHEEYGVGPDFTWDHIINYIDINLGGVSGNEIIFLSFENMDEQENVNYLIFPKYELDSNTLHITNFKELIIYYAEKNYEVIDLEQLHEKKENIRKIVLSKQDVIDETSDNDEYQPSWENIIMTLEASDKYSVDFEKEIIYVTFEDYEQTIVSYLIMQTDEYKKLGITNFNEFIIYDRSASETRYYDITQCATKNYVDSKKEYNIKLYYQSLNTGEDLEIYTNFYTDEEYVSSQRFIEKYMPNGTKSASGWLMIDGDTYVVYGIEKTTYDNLPSLRVLAINISNGGSLNSENVYDYSVLTAVKQ